MIDPKEFRDRWCDDDDVESLIVYSPDALDEISVPSVSREFLTSAGLPESAAPFLDFRAPESGRLQTAADLWQLSPEFNRYHIIGSNGSGDPLCIDESQDCQVIYLNHDLRFHRVLINSSVSQLGESLLAFRQLIRETQRQNGEDAFLDGDVPSDLQQWLLNELIRIDPATTHPDCFWSHELRSIREDST